MKATIWLSFDLGVRGDYESLYSWLDEQGAKECGQGLAFLTYDYDGDFIDALKTELKIVLGQTAKPRIYVIHSVGKQKGGKGQWLFGGRKSAPWTGFGTASQQEVDQ